MKHSKGLILIIFLILPFAIFPQGYAALPALGLNPNPQSFGMGMSGVSLPTNDPLGFYFNPAMLGYSSQTINLAIQSYTERVNWLPGLFYSSNKYNNSGFTAGYNFGKVLKGFNLSAGVGFISSKLDYGEYLAYDPITQRNYYVNSFDEFNSFGAGVSIDYFVNLSLGLTLKSIDSKLGSLPKNEVKLNAIDWGMLLNVPISKLAFKKLAYKPNENMAVKPVVNFSTGYSRSNIGDEISYVDPAQKDPLPLTARLGYTLSLGAEFQVNSHLINIVTYDISVEAEDLLVSVDMLSNITYQGLLGDIDVWKNLFEWKQTGYVTLRKGQRINFFETFSILYGSNYNGSPYNHKTNGIVVSSNGIFKLLSWNFDDNDFIKYFLDHFEFKYFKSSWDAGIPNYYTDFYPIPVKTDMEAISISFKGFTF